MTFAQFASLIVWVVAEPYRLIARQWNFVTKRMAPAAITSIGLEVLFMFEENYSNSPISGGIITMLMFNIFITIYIVEIYFFDQKNNRNYLELLSGLFSIYIFIITESILTQFLIYSLRSFSIGIIPLTQV